MLHCTQREFLGLLVIPAKLVLDLIGERESIAPPILYGDTGAIDSPVKPENDIIGRFHCAGIMESRILDS